MAVAAAAAAGSRRPPRPAAVCMVASLARFAAGYVATARRRSSRERTIIGSAPVPGGQGRRRALG
eukprot:COSAG01_NODE_5219_length_4404_cov_19.378397_9_plen_65_part_00